MITRENIYQHELVGLDAKIVQSSNQQMVGIKGTVINETKSMLQLQTQKGIKNIPKNGNIWTFNENDHGIIVDGSKIQKRSFERLGGKN